MRTTPAGKLAQGRGRGLRWVAGAYLAYHCHSTPFGIGPAQGRPRPRPDRGRLPLFNIARGAGALQDLRPYAAAGPAGQHWWGGPRDPWL